MSQQNKTIPTKLSVQKFIDAIPDAEQRADSQKLVEIMKDVTGEEPVMWGTAIIGFRPYHYKYASGREGDMCKVGFSPRKDSLSLYLMGIMYQIDTPQKILDRLGKYKHGKGCLYIKHLSEVDLDALKELITLAANSKLSVEV